MRKLIVALIVGGLLMAQPVLIRYTLGSKTIEIPAHYTGGLEGSLTPGIERSAVRLVCHEPLWKNVHETAASLVVKQSLTVTNVIAKVGGQWTALGPPSSGGTIYTIVEAPNKDIYIGGVFTNWDGIASADYIARWDGSSWNAVGSGLNAEVEKMAFDALGNLYVVGQFTNAGGVLNADYIALWDGSSWNAVGNPNSGGATITVIRDLAFDSLGNLYVVGDIHNLAGVAANDFIAKWDGSGWSTVGTPSVGVGYPYDIEIDSQDNIYISGAFTNWGGIANADYVAMWDGSSWNALGTGLNSEANALALDLAGRVYVGGGFTATGDWGTTLNNIARWNGTAWEGLGSGVSGGYVEELALGPDGLLYAGGKFTSAGGLTLADRAAVWNGSTWLPLSVDLPGAANVWAIMTTAPGAGEKYDLYMGFGTSGTAYVSNTTLNINNAGSVPTYPRIKIKRTGGTSATLESIINETSGEQLLFDLSLLDGETVTIDLCNKVIVSDYRGNLINKLLPTSDLATWSLLPGSNDVSVYVSDAGGPTVTALFIWRERFWSADDS